MLISFALTTLSRNFSTQMDRSIISHKRFAAYYIYPWHWPKENIRPKIGMKAISQQNYTQQQAVIVKYNGFLVVLCRIVLPLKYFLLFSETKL